MPDLQAVTSALRGRARALRASAAETLPRLASRLRRRGVVAALAVLLFAGLWARGQASREGLPYLHHWDEPFVANRALRILQTGDFNPRFFNYGSLRIYLQRRGAGRPVSSAVAELAARERALGVETVAWYESFAERVRETKRNLLEFLIRYQGQVVTRKMHCEHLWESDWEGVTNVVEVHINRLRGKIDRGFDEPLIQTVRGRGYVLRTT